MKAKAKAFFKTLIILFIYFCSLSLLFETFNGFGIKIFFVVPIFIFIGVIMIGTFKRIFNN